MAIKHTKVATVADDGTSEVGTNEWNDNHTIDNNTVTDVMVSSHTTTKITVPTTQLSGTVTNTQLAGSIANTKLATDPLARANHTGTQAASTVSDFDVEVANNSAVTANTAKISYSVTASNAVAANTAKTGITSGQATAITDNATAIALRAPIASPTFTGTVVLPNVPAIVTTQLDLKAPLSSPTLVTPNIGTPSAGTLTSCTGLPATTGLTATGTKDSTTFLRGDDTWTAVVTYSAPTIGSTSIASGSTNATIAGLTLTAPTLTGTTTTALLDVAGNNIDNIQNIIHDTSVTTTALNFSLDQLQTISIDAATTFTTSNRALGGSKTIKILNSGASVRAFTFPAWKFVGAEPADLAAGKTAILTLTCFGTADTDIVAGYSFEA